jgi:hypothetical protein
MGGGFNTRGAVSGGASGAAAGASFGPWGAAIGGVAGSVLGGFMSGQDMSKEEAARNALLANQAAEAAESKGAAEAGRVRGQAIRAMARAKVAMIAKGAAGEGISDVLKGMSINAETDAETVRNNAAREAWGYRNQAATSLYEGAVAEDRANQAMLSSILGGAGQGVASYAHYRQLQSAIKSPAASTAEG